MTSILSKLQRCWSMTRWLLVRLPGNSPIILVLMYYVLILRTLHMQYPNTVPLEPRRKAKQMEFIST